MQCVCGKELTRLGLYDLPLVDGAVIRVQVCQCPGCGRLELVRAEDPQTLAEYEAKLQDKTAEELTLLAFSAQTALEREAAENVLWNNYHELASY